MYSISSSIEALSNNTSGLQDVMTGLNKSRFWTIISRSASGILPNFWAVQNKFRAITDAFAMYYEGHEKGNKQMMAAINAQVQLADALDTLNPKLLDSNTTFEDFADIAATTVKEYGAIEKASKMLTEELVRRGEISADDADAFYEEDVRKKTTGILEPQQKQLKEAEDRLLQESLNQRELEMAKNPVHKFFIKQRQKLTAFTKLIGPVLKGMLKMIASAMLWGTVILFGILVIVTIIKELWPYLQSTRKMLVFYFKMIFDALIMIVGGIFNMVVGALQGDWSKFFGGLGQVVMGILQGLMGMLGIVVAIAVAGIELLVRGIFMNVISMKDKFWGGLKKLIGFVATIYAAIYLIAAAVTLITTGLWIPALAYALGSVIAILIAKAMKFKFRAGGGTVNEDMTVVGEKGPELVSLPRGSRVHTNADSQRMMGNTTNITVNVQGRIGASDAEVKDMATKVAREINIRMNRTGTTTTRFT